MNDATLIADLVRAGLDAELVQRVVNAVVFSSHDNRTIIDDERAEAKRQRDRIYQQNKRNLTKTGKQTMPGSPSNNRTINRTTSRDDAINRCQLTPLLSSLSSTATPSEPQQRKEEQAGKRGTRMVGGALMPDECRDFAMNEGFSGGALETMWLEFVDYWSGVPGQRGLKVNWLGTWRNRVRDVKSRRGNNGAKHGTHTMAAVDQLIADEQARSGDGNGPLLDLKVVSSRTS